MSSAAVRRVSDFVRRAAGAAPADGDLLSRVVIDRDEDAFAAIVRRHGSAVRAACRRVLGDTPDADDAFQATFVVLWRDAGRVRKTGSVGAWLYGAAHRIACQARIVASRRHRLEKNVAATRPAVAVLPDPSWRESCDMLHEELNQLPDRYRLPLVLCYLEGKSRDEAAKQLGWSIGSVRGRLERGRDRLRRRLIRRGIDLSAGLLAVLSGERSLAAIVPATLVRATVAATTSSPSAAVAALVGGATTSTHAWLAAVGIMMSLAAAGTGVGLWTRNFRADNPAVVAAPAADPTKPPAAVAALPPTPVVAQDPSKPPVHGRVLDPDGKPVAGAKLFLPANQASITGMIAQLFSPRAVATTDTDGRFAFTAESPPRGQGSLLPVIAVAAGFGPDWADATKPAANGELTLRLVADDGPIRGRVVDLEGRPVPGATAAADPKLLLDSRPVEGIIVAKANRAMNSPRYSAADCLIPPA